MILLNLYTGKVPKSDKIEAASSRIHDSEYGITVAEKWLDVQPFSACDLGERCAALGCQAVFLEVAHRFVRNRPLNQSYRQGNVRKSCLYDNFIIPRTHHLMIRQGKRTPH